MNANAIYSKSGKGAQEASGKTNLLQRSDRAVLSAIDGRTTLAEVAEKVGKTFDPAFQTLVEALDKAGFIRQVSAGTAGAAKKPGAKAAAKPAATSPMDAASDLDFTQAPSVPRAKAPPAPPSRPGAAMPPAPPPPSAAEKVKAERAANEQQDAFARAREEAERKAQADRDRIKAEAEAKMRAETESKLRADAKDAADRKFAAELEARAQTAQAAAAAAAAQAKAEAEAQRAREEAERARREAEEKERLRREAEEKARREQEELQRKLEAERRAREEAERKAREEAERRAHEEALRREEEEFRRLQAQAASVVKEQAPAPAAGGGSGFSDSLLADLASFSTTEERRAKEEAERQERGAKELRKREQAERKANEEAELRAREERDKQRLQEEEEKRKREAEERERKAKQEEKLVARAERGSAFTEEAQLRSRREREFAAKPRAAGAARAARKGWGKPAALTLLVLAVVAFGAAHVVPLDVSDFERAAGDALGRTVKIGSANLSLVRGPELKLGDVRIGEGVRIAEVRAVPELDTLLGATKAFSRIELERVKLEQSDLGHALFAKVKADGFRVRRLAARDLELAGPLALPKGLEVEAVYDGEGRVRAVIVRGPEALVARLTSSDAGFDVDMSAASFTLPFAPEISLSRFSMKGAATPRGLSVSDWQGALLSGTLSGTASVRWGESWAVDGMVSARNINAAVFAPALLSDGRGEGNGRFSMRGAPGKLASSSRLDGSFTVTRGVLGTIDLQRAIQTGGKQASGRTQFNEMNGQGSYDRGAVSLRNVTIGAGQLNAGASADIAQNGALSGRIVADVRVAAQTFRATLSLGGTVKEPQVKN